MKRLFINLISILLGLLLGGLGTYAHADTYNATLIWTYIPNSSTARPTGSTAAAACTGGVSIVAASSFDHTVVVSSSQETCFYKFPSNAVLSSGYTTRSSSCPSGGTISGNGTATPTCINAPACVAPQVRNTTTGVCETPAPTCTAGNTSYSGAGTSGFYTASGNEPPSNACINGCTVQLTGQGISIGSAGTTTQKSTTGAQTGASCTGTNVGTVSTAEEQCVDQGKSFLTVGSATQCVAPGTPNAPTVTKKTTSSSTSTNSSGTTTNNTTTNTTVNNNTVTVTNTTVTTNPDGTTSTATNGTTQPLNTYCQANPAASICTDGSFSNGATGNGSGGTTDMSGVESTLDDIKDNTKEGSSTVGTAQPSDLYEKKDKTFDNVLTDFSDKVKALPFMTATNGFFNVTVGGACPTWSLTIPPFQIMIDQFCSPVAESLWPIVRVALLLVAGFYAFRWAVL